MYSGESFKQTGQVAEHQMGAMTYEDGFSMVNRMNISTTLQVYDNVSAEEKERFEHWKIFNKHMRRFYDAHTVVNGTRTGTSFKPMLKELKT